MKILLMLKRILRTPALLIMLVITFACILLSGTLSEDDGIPTCGIVCGDDPIAQAITDSLAKDGMVFCKDEEELIYLLQKGKITMGMILPDDLTERLETGNTEKMIRVIETPVTFLPSIHRYRVSAYIIEEFTPYLTSSLLSNDKFTITPDEMREYISEYLTDEEVFSFTIETAAGEAVEIEHYAFKLTKGAVALFLFFAFALFAVPFAEKQFAPLAKRVGLGKAFLSYVLPLIVIVAVLFASISSAALAVSDKLFSSGTNVLIIPAVIYSVFLSGIGTLAISLVRTADRLRVPMIIICVASVGFCPIFANLPAMLNIPEYVGYILPPMFFYAAVANPIVSGAVAIILFAVSMFVLYMAYRKRFDLK